jgi:hypothetical protein
LKSTTFRRSFSPKKKVIRNSWEILQTGLPLIDDSAESDREQQIIGFEDVLCPKHEKPTANEWRKKSGNIIRHFGVVNICVTTFEDIEKKSTYKVTNYKSLELYEHKFGVTR